MRQKSDHTASLSAGIEAELWRVALPASKLCEKKYPREVILAPEFGSAFIFQGVHRLVRVVGSVRF